MIIGQAYRMPNKVRELNFILGIAHLDLGLAILGKRRQELNEPLREDEVIVRQRPERSREDWKEINEVIAVADAEGDRFGGFLWRPAVYVQLSVGVLAAVAEVVHENLMRSG